MFVELLKESNIHSVHYISNKKLKTIERIFWMITICVLMVFSSVLVSDSIKNLQSNSVIVAIDEKIWSDENVEFEKLLT